MRSDRTERPQHGKHATPAFLASSVAQPAGAGWQPRRIAWMGATIGLVVLGGPAALADEAPDLLADPFMLSLGTFILDTDARGRLDGDDGLGTQIDWEEDIGSGEATRIRFDGTWRFTERNKLRALWFSNSVSRSTRLEEDISWGDVVYPASVKVGTDFEFDVFELAYELSGTIGLHDTELTLAIEGEGTVDGESMAGRVRAVFLPVDRRLPGQPAGLPDRGALAAAAVDGRRVRIQPVHLRRRCRKGRIQRVARLDVPWPAHVLQCELLDPWMATAGHAR